MRDAQTRIADMLEAIERIERYAAHGTETGRWQCTDVGSRVIVAIKLDHDDDPSWYNGPPYAVLEHSFDEDDQIGCALNPADL